tara:strand:+ start:584 stop:895 length:312 start_codon:yes stop_codon:yes gene_type:complete
MTIIKNADPAIDDTIQTSPYMGALRCPVCEEDYTHLIGVSMSCNSGDGNGRPIATLDIYCEHGHRFDVVVNQHKGFTVFHYSNMRNLDSSEFEWADPQTTTHQ